MSESKWTPGPWFVSGVRFKMNGGEWLSVNRYDEQTKKDENIALAGYDPRNGAGTADARLIAAAPDLAEALEKLITAVEESCRTVDRQFIQLEIDTARAALSRAKGGTQ